MPNMKLINQPERLSITDIDLLLTSSIKPSNTPDKLAHQGPGLVFRAKETTINAGCRAFNGRARVTRPFDQFPQRFHQEPLLGVHGNGFAWADSKELGVEAFNPF